MKKTLFLSALTVLFAFGAQAQSTNLVMPPGELAVFKGGDNTGTWNISSSKAQPCFVQVYDTVTNNQAAPILSIPLPTNGSAALWINDHAGSEGGGISRTINREFLAMEGYTGNIISPTNAKPSADPTVPRGIVTLDAFTNLTPIYSDLANWFGLPPGVTQNNPTGIASTDGTNFWGTGNFTGTSFEDSGVLFYNGNFSSTPVELENYIQSAGEARIIGGVLYIVVPGSGVFNFVDPDNNDALVPLPIDPDVPNPVEHIVLTNLFLNWGSTFKNVSDFDMNPSATIAYGADQTFGIVKFTNNSGAWQEAYLFNSNNIGTAKQKASTQGCFGICVDFSGANPVIYATTMETGTSPVNNSQGNPNQNRLIRIVDNGNPGTNLVAQTLATAGTTNETFRGVDFTPDLQPLVTSVPANYSTTNGGSASFSVGADSVFPLSYQWLQNGSVLGGATSPTLNLTALDTSFDGFTYQCIVSNQYGAVTSAPAAMLTVTLTAQPPVISSSAENITAFVGGTETFASVTPSSGTEPFTFQWYFGTTQLMDDGVKYSGSATASLSISNLTTGDSGSYYLVAANSAGFASNKVDVLTVNYHPAVITAGEPVSVTTFVGDTTSLTATESGGSLPVTNQWFKGSTQLSDGGEYSGTQTGTLTISPASLSDAGSYKLVISNPAGSVTSSSATVTVLVPPPLSQVSYSNQVYLQNFDSLPDPGSNSVNSFNNPMDPGSIITATSTNSYSLANPFDFTYPIINQSYVGGLGLSNTMQGWYGAADTLFPGVDTITRFGAQDGDQTTGGVIDFGPNDNGGINGTNRALGLLSTSTTGSTTFALKLVNTSGNALNYVSLSFIGELWHNGTGARTMSFGYTLDPTANSFTLTSQSISNSTLVPGLNFSFPTVSTVTAVDGTQPANQIDLATNNLALASQWQPGAALWLIWAIDYYGSGSGNGYAIDNLYFHGSVNPTVPATAPIILNNTAAADGSFSFNFTNAPNAVFTVQYTTNLTAPITWQTLGTPTETPNGLYSTYSFTDTQAAGRSRFYRVVSH